LEKRRFFLPVVSVNPVLQQLKLFASYEEILSLQLLALVRISGFGPLLAVLSRRSLAEPETSPCHHGLGQF